MRPLLRIWIWATPRHLDQPRCKTKNHWRSIDTHFQDGAGSVFLWFFAQKAANASFMLIFDQSPLRLPKMESQKSLTLGWRWFSEWVSDCVTFSSAYKGCQWVDYEYFWPDQSLITIFTRPTIVDAPLTLTFRIGQWPCRCVFSLQRLAIHWLCESVTKLSSNYIPYMTKNRWRSVDAHFQNGAASMSFCSLPIRLPICWLYEPATELISNDLTYMTRIHWRSVDAHSQNWAVTVLLSLLHMKAANTLVMWINDQIDL